MSLSLDLSRAYDLASRPIIYETLANYGVSQDTITVIQQLHRDAQYVFRAGPNTGRHTTTNGLKQGCCIAPFLWCFYTVALMQVLQDKLGTEWIAKALVLFADDHWAHWIIRSREDFTQALAQLKVVLETLVEFKMSINYSKTAVLIRLEGKQAKTVMYENTRMKNGTRHLCVQVKGHTQLIPIKEVHEHLGTKVWSQAQLAPPGQVLLSSLQNFQRALIQKAASAPDITTQPAILDRVAQLEATLRDQLEKQKEHDAQTPTDMGDVPCPYCDAVFITEHAMRETTVPACTANEPPDTATGILQNVPLIERDWFTRKLPQWEDLLRDHKLRDDLRSHCVLCHMWVASYTKIKQHITRVHEPETPGLNERALNLCVSFKQHLVRNRSSGPQLSMPDNVSSCTKSALQKHAANGRMAASAPSLNPEADIFAFCAPELLTRHHLKKEEQEEGVEKSEESQPPKRARPEPSPLFPAALSNNSSTRSRRPQKQQPKPQIRATPELKLMTKVMLHHEDQLAAQRMDKDFVLFLRQDYASIIPNLHAISVEWESKKEQGHEGLTSSKRTLLLACMIKELLARVQKMSSTDPGQEKLRRASWMTPEGEWTFMKWCHKNRKLVVNSGKASISHAELTRLLSFILENLRGDIIHKFHSTQSLADAEADMTNHPSVTFLLGIALRGEKANELHETLCTLLGCSAWQLIGVSIKRETMKRAPAVRELAKMVLGY
ncbi:unnamed protein product [Symbiodinium sp. CCMP2592]|nr:unnamed protein product [Symbiodinium sp. CCMP2592]